jgi:hypothetical protein
MIAQSLFEGYWKNRAKLPLILVISYTISSKTALLYLRLQFNVHLTADFC